MTVPLSNFLVAFSFLVPTSPPLDVNGTKENSTSITVSWGSVPIQHRRGVIIGYVVTVVEHGGGSETQYNASNRSLNIGGLKKFTFYNITVSARTSKGISNASAVFRIQTAEDGKLISYSCSVNCMNTRGRLPCEKVGDARGKI